MDKEEPLEFELHCYVDGVLDDEAMARMENCIRKHPEMAAKVRDYLQQKDDIRSFARAATATGPSAAINTLERQLARRLKRNALYWWRRVGVIAALVVVGWLGHVVYVPLVEGPEFTNEILQAHILTSGFPDEMLPISEERIGKLFARIGEIEHLPDLRSLGFQPAGAQLLPSDEGIVLHVPYRDAAGTTISYFLFHDRHKAEVPLHLLHREGFTIAYWQHDYSRYALAAQLSDEQTARIAEFVESAPDIF
ncbi:MAG TPA: hypothetical protein VM616_10070 [Gammaproteobacteria bacterium]|nr:hypothetical protein [Gammaproteobacteria bacterium]